jgi:hypothetical protein
MVTKSLFFHDSVVVIPQEQVHGIDTVISGCRYSRVDSVQPHVEIIGT